MCTSLLRAEQNVMFSHTFISTSCIQKNPHLTIVCGHTFYTLRKITDEDCVKIKQKINIGKECVKIKQKINIVITKPTYLLSI